MNTIQMARTAYSTHATPIRTPRSTEFDAFAQITRRLKAASDQGKSGFPALASALHDNRRLWTLMAGDVASSDNGLPQDLRGQLFYLAEFTLQHTSKVLGGNAEADVLIEINTSLMRGLRQIEAAA